MLKVNIFYPAGGDDAFDMDYYLSSHLPMIQRVCEGACKSVGAERGIGGFPPGTPAPYVAIGYLFFDSLEEFQRTFVPHTAGIVADVPNYTKIQPQLQLSEITQQP
jgi:uncharacterized protein (TIGR02118 family)